MHMFATGRLSVLVSGGGEMCVMWRPITGGCCPLPEHVSCDSNNKQSTTARPPLSDIQFGIKIHIKYWHKYTSFLHSDILILSEKDHLILICLHYLKQTKSLVFKQKGGRKSIKARLSGCLLSLCYLQDIFKISWLVFSTRTNLISRSKKSDI